MKELIIWTIEGVKFNKKNGEMVIPPDDPQYMKVEFASSLLDDLKIPYRIRIDKSDKNTSKYRFILDEMSDIQVSIDNIYVVQNILKMTLG